MDANTAQVLTLGITTSFGALGVAFGLWIALQNRRLDAQAAKTQNEVTSVKADLVVVKKELNGHTETLLAAVKGEGKAIGKSEGIAQERGEQRARSDDQSNDQGREATA